MKRTVRVPMRKDLFRAACESAMIRSHIRLMGCHAGWTGNAITTCPKLTPQLRKVWLSGWRCGRKEYNMWDRGLKAILHRKRQEVGRRQEAGCGWLYRTNTRKSP